MLIMTIIGVLAISTQWWFMSKAPIQTKIAHFGLLFVSLALATSVTVYKNLMLLYPLFVLFQGASKMIYQAM